MVFTVCYSCPVDLVLSMIDSMCFGNSRTRCQMLG